MKIQPEPQDYQAVERKHGPLPARATEKELADRYRLAQAQALCRLREQGQLRELFAGAKL